MGAVIVASIFLAFSLIAGVIYLLITGRCKHEWETREKHIEPSKMEKANQQGYEMTKAKGGIHPVWLERSMYIIMVCKKCGKVEEYEQEL